MFGYRFLVDYIQQKTDEKESLFDNNSYDDSQLVELKFPGHLQYQNSWASFERYNGEIQLGGTMYKYVKRKLSNDRFCLMCVRNSKKMRLKNAKNDFFKISNDISQNDNFQKSDNLKSVFKNLLTLYNESSFELNIIFPFTSNQNFWLSLKNQNLFSAQSSSPLHPPDLLVGKNFLLFYYN